MTSPIKKRNLDELYSSSTASLSPPESPTNKIAQGVFSTPPSQPKKKFIFRVTPDKINASTLFPNLLATNPSEFSLDISGPTKQISQTEKYGLDFPLIEQPPQKSSCGTAACLMAALTATGFDIKTIKNLPKDFLNWYTTASLTRAKDIVQQLAILGKKGEWITFRTDKQSDAEKNQTFIDVKDAKATVEKIKEQLDTPEKTIILAITHERLDGHWVVLNQMNSDQFLLRDPYSGKGFNVKGEDLEPLILKEVAREHAILI